MPLLRQLETDVILRFERALSARAAFGGQERELADYLLAANARFALVEFTTGVEAIANEDGKALRHKLCRALGACRQSAALARDIHYFAWGMKTGEGVSVAPYAGAVCPLLDEDFPVRAEEGEPADRFLRRFLGSRTAGASARRFKAYLELLQTIAGGLSDSALRRFAGAVYVSDASSTPAVHGFRFRSLDHLLELTSGRSPTLSR